MPISYTKVIELIRLRHTALPTLAWEIQAAELAGINVDLLRFALSFFLAVAVGAGIRPIRIPFLRNLYALVTGLLLVYYPFGNGMFHAFPPILLTYLGMMVAPKWCGVLGWLINFPYLIALHTINASGSSWNKGELDFTGAEMVLVLKLISLCVSHQDAKARKSEELNDYQKSKALPQRPAFLEYLGFCFCFGNLLAGPAFEYKDYYNFIHLKESYTRVPGVPQPSPLVPGLQALFRAVVSLAVHMTLQIYFPFTVLHTPWYQGQNLGIRLAVLWLVGFVYRNKYYFAWSISEASLVLSGLSFEPGVDGAKPTWDKYRNSFWYEVETTDSFRLLPVVWNVHTGVFLRRYVYDRLTPRNGRPSFLTLALTQLVSAVWHGLYAGYILFFLSSALAMHAATCLFKWEKTILAPLAKNPLWKALKVVYTAMVLNYLASAFLILALMPCLEVFASVYYLPHILMFAITGLQAAFPGRSPKPAAKTQ